jgi:outer membrane receptor for ferrienterochelin and colicins
MRGLSLVSIVFLACTALAQETEDLERLSLEELMNVHVVTASNMSERLSEAPATVIVISREDIRRRGYHDLSRILDDLPGMNVVRPYGATYLKNYWRGYRNTVGDPFLIMIDGVVFNHLYFNTTDIMTTFPLTNVERVEVVYGPASSVYGANAFMGVINVITRNDELQPGFYETTDLAAGSNESRLIDTSFLFKAGEARIRLTARIDEGDIDRDAAQHYEYSKNRYAADRRLWGGFVDIPRIGGSTSAPRRNRGFDLRFFAGNLEAALQYFRLDAGYGVEYATDRSQNHAVWSRPDASAYARYVRPLSGRIRASTMVRYRSSGVASDSYFTESLPGTPAAPEETVTFSYWSSRNSSWSLFQDFDVKISEALAFRAGVRWEQKDLQKAYDTNYGPAIPVSIADGTSYPFPESPGSGNQQNRIDTEDTGVYLQSWYRVSEHHRLNVGIRSDHNSKYGEATTLRLGYVGRIGGWGLKALYGQAFQEPNNRLLYGGWDGSGSDPQLQPERSTTIELSAERTSKSLSQLLSVYRVRNRDTFVNTVHTAQNLGAREVVGLDYHARVVLPVPRVDTNAWLFYSRLLRTTEKKLDAEGLEIGEGSIGDLARDQIRIGVTAVHGDLTATLRGRYIGAIETVETNPVRTIGGYGVFDAFFRADGVLGSSLGVSLTIDNVANRTYFHPGVRDANAGTTPGSFDAAGVWQGSRGYYNSLLAQPGRIVMVGLHFNLPK